MCSAMTSRCLGGRFLLRQSQPCVCPGYPALPAVLRGVERPWTSSTVFGVCGLLVGCHVVRLERCAFGCGRHAAQTCARAACSSFHSQGEACPVPWVPS